MQSKDRTLARPAAPLATGVMKITFVDKNQKIAAMATSLEGSKN